jgi:hypothetical protein
MDDSKADLVVLVILPFSSTQEPFLFDRHFSQVFQPSCQSQIGPEPLFKALLGSPYFDCVVLLKLTS